MTGCDHHGVLKLATDLLLLERGGDELLALSPSAMKPLYVPRGKNYIKEFLSSIGEIGSGLEILQRFPEDQALLELLVQKEIVLDSEQETGGQEQNHGQKPGEAFRLRDTTTLQLILTQSCNARCVYCLNGQRSYQKNQHLQMKPKVAFKGIDRHLEQLSGGGILQIALFGGEPLLNWPLAKKITEYALETAGPRHPDKKIEFTLTSNLTLLPPDFIDWALEHQVTMLCDIDGPQAIHDMCRPLGGGKPSFQTTADNIRSLTAAGLDVAARATVTSLNQDHLLEAMLTHKSLGCSASGMDLLNPVNSDGSALPAGLYPQPEKALEAFEATLDQNIWSLDRLHPLNQFKKKMQPHPDAVVGCGMSEGKMPVVYINGDVYPCIYLVGNPAHCLGNVFNAAYPNESRLVELHQQYKVDNLQECKDCLWRHVCGGGCAAFRPETYLRPELHQNDRLIEYAREANCVYRRGMFELILWKWAAESQQSFDQHLDLMVDRPIHLINTC